MQADTSCPSVNLPACPFKPQWCAVSLQTAVVCAVETLSTQVVGKSRGDWVLPSHQQWADVMGEKTYTQPLHHKQPFI